MTSNTSPNDTSDTSDTSDMNEANDTHDMIGARSHIEAAYACDRVGDEAEAAVHYEAAWRLGLPADVDRAGFLLGFGSTLKNVGRLDESEAILRQAIASAPDNLALELFLALTLEQRGKTAEALARAIEVCLVMTTRPAPEVARYARALAEYVEELRREP
jgi:tetratricopeptide (TPR) repeat protein